MEITTFRRWLAEQGCRFDQQEQRQRHDGHVSVTVHREDKKAALPAAGSHEILDPRLVRKVCEELGLDWSKLPGPSSRV